MISRPRPKAKHNIIMPSSRAVTWLLAYKLWENCGGWLSHLGVLMGCVWWIWNRGSLTDRGFLMGAPIVLIVESVAILLMEALGGDIVCWWSVRYSVWELCCRYPLFPQFPLFIARPPVLSTTLNCIIMLSRLLRQHVARAYGQDTLYWL